MNNSQTTGAEWSRHSQLAWYGQTFWGAYEQRFWLQLSQEIVVKKTSTTWRKNFRKYSETIYGTERFLEF